MARGVPRSLRSRIFFISPIPKEQILSLLGSSRSLPKFLEDLEQSKLYDYLTFFLSKIKKSLYESILESLKIIKLSQSIDFLNFPSFTEAFFQLQIFLILIYPTFLMLFSEICLFIYSPKFPQDPEEQIYIPRSPRNEKLPLPDMMSQTKILPIPVTALPQQCNLICPSSPTKTNLEQPHM